MPAEEPPSAIAGADESLQPTPERLADAKTPDNILPPGTTSDYGGSRDSRDLLRAKKDMAKQPDIDEKEEVTDNDLVSRAKEKGEQ